MFGLLLLMCSPATLCDLPLLGLFDVSLLSGKGLSQTVLMLALAVVAYIVARQWFTPAQITDAIGKAMPVLTRVGGLIEHIDSLGLPVFKPLITAAASGNVAEFPNLIASVLDKLDDKEKRKSILETLFWARFAHWVEDRGRTELLIERLTPIAAKLGFTITKTPPAA